MINLYLRLKVIPSSFIFIQFLICLLRRNKDIVLISSNKEVFNIVQEYKNIYGCVGIHPEETLTYKINDLEEMEKALNSDKTSQAVSMPAAVM